MISTEPICNYIYIKEMSTLIFVTLSAWGEILLLLLIQTCGIQHWQYLYFLMQARRLEQQAELQKFRNNFLYLIYDSVSVFPKHVILLLKCSHIV